MSGLLRTKVHAAHTAHSAGQHGQYGQHGQHELWYAKSQTYIYIYYCKAKFVKISYKCLPNMGSIIAKQNSKILKNNKEQDQTQQNVSCNCNNKDECPTPGKCLTEAIIYQATVNSENKEETYIGLTANSMKVRFTDHKNSFKYEEKRKKTTLSKYIWKLKDENKPYSIKWKIMARAQPFSQTTNQCQLCTREKYFIVYKPELCTLNSRNELFSSCRHKRTKLLVPPDKNAD